MKDMLTHFLQMNHYYLVLLSLIHLLSILGTAVCNSNSVKAEVIVNNLIEIVNNELLLKKVINNINKNKSSKLKLTLTTCLDYSLGMIVILYPLI